MLYSEFLTGTGLSASRLSSKAYDLVNAIYTASEDMTKQEAYSLYADTAALREQAERQAKEYDEIEIWIWEDVPGKLGLVRHIGNRTVKSVRDDLQVMLLNRHPDEMSILDYGLTTSVWKNTDAIPEFRTIRTTVNYGSNEGIYLDVCILKFDNTLETLYTAKTLLTDVDAMQTMYRLAAAITCSFKFHG